MKMNKLKRYSVSPCGIKDKGMLDKDFYEADLVDILLESNEFVNSMLTGYLPRWIPVSERLPEFELAHLVLIDHAGYLIRAGALWFGGIWTDCDDSRLDVTHWLDNVPPPPEA